MKDLGDYYGRLFAWYLNGGFIDEYGLEHVSNHHYEWDYTEIFNEVESEHTMNPESYTRAYDAVIQGIRRHTNNTQMKYVGMSLGGNHSICLYVSTSCQFKLQVTTNLNGIVTFSIIPTMHRTFRSI